MLANHSHMSCKLIHVQHFHKEGCPDSVSLATSIIRDAYFSEIDGFCTNFGLFGIQQKHTRTF